MTTVTLKTPLPHFMPPGLQMYLPLGIPDRRRRPRINPWPVRSAVYFGEDHAWPVTIRHAQSNESKTAG